MPGKIVSVKEGKTIYRDKTRDGFPLYVKKTKIPRVPPWFSVAWSPDAATWIGPFGTYARAKAFLN